MKLTRKTKMTGAILAITFAVYNIVLFVICGFSGHGAVFWLSYVFMLLAFAAMTVAGVLLGKKGIFLRDWLFGYPIIKHSTVYIFAEFIASTVFIALDEYVKWPWAFAVQLILLGAYLVVAISCLLSKETIEDVETKVKDKTDFIRLLCIDTEMICEKCADAELKNEFQKLADTVRHSDPMSNENLFELEKEIACVVAQADKCTVDGENGEARALCEKALLLLFERNRKCKALK